MEENKCKQYNHRIEGKIGKKEEGKDQKFITKFVVSFKFFPCNS